MKKFNRIHVIVMDSAGIGCAPDAAKFGDENANTLKHISESVDNFNIPNLIKMGIANICELKNIQPPTEIIGYAAKMREASCGKDTMTGHWELMGLHISEPFQVFPNGFPVDLIDKIEKFSGRKVIVNAPASGTEVIAQYGEHQMKTGDLIVYTSADSVLQIAAHEEIIPLEELYKICDYCRSITRSGPYALGRIIARPYIGTSSSNFTRTSNRHDYALKPFGKTVMNSLKEANYDSIAIGKINDIFDGEGVTEVIKTKSNDDGMDKLIALVKSNFTGLSFTNLVDFDALYGHRRNPSGYAHSLEEFDIRLGELLDILPAGDLLILTADHGNDPTAPGTDHTREMVPLLMYSKDFKHNGILPSTDTFADLGATIADNFNVEIPPNGKSLLNLLN